MKGFGLDQIWAQIEHHTEQINAKLIGNLTKLMNDDDFLKELAEGAHSTSDELENSDKNGEGSNDGADEDGSLAGDYGEESGEDEADFDLMKKRGKKDADNFFDKEEDASDVEAFMEGLEEDEMAEAGLKIPKDVQEDMDEGDDYDDEYDEEDGGLFPEDKGDGYAFEKADDDFDMMEDLDGPKKGSKGKADSDDEAEDEMEDVFAQANAQGEMDLVDSMKKQVEFVNQDQVGKIEQIEDEMMNPKSWEMVGEAAAKDRPVNSLLEVHLDFNAATKLPPTITKETTNTIEALVKQRVLDELFDDPILKNAS